MPKRDREGAVLIVVLLVLAAAVALILECGKYLRIDYASAGYQRTMVAGGALLRSGMDMAKEILLEDLRRDGVGADHHFDNWATTDEFFEEVSASLQSGQIRGAITAENGRISLNALKEADAQQGGQGEIFVRLVEELCKRHGIVANSRHYLASIRIWLGDADTRQDRAWYASRDPSYAPARGAFHTPRELLLVRWRGVSSEDLHRIYFGTEDIPGLHEFITVWGDGKINMNTARPEIVAALVQDSRRRSEFVRAVLDYRGRGENLLSGQWYKNIAVRLRLDMTQFPQGALDVKSSVFRVTLSAEVGAGRLNSTTLLKRDTQGCVVLFENIH